MKAIKTICIISFWKTENNYGQVLQCYALQEFLRNQGHSPFHIKYSPQYRINGIRSIINIPVKLWKAIYFRTIKRKTYLKELDRIQKEAADQRNHPRHFSKFKEKYLTFSDIEFDQYQVKNRPPQADIYITGSDQVWSIRDSNYFLYFAPKEKLKISYAASFGGAQYGDQNKDFLQSSLKYLDYISVRERNGLQLCQSLGIEDAVMMPDPTLLLPVEKYEQLISSAKIHLDSKKYVFTYLLGHKMDFSYSNLVEWVELNLRIPIKYVSGQGNVDSYTKIYPSIEEWLLLIKNAEYVVTNSFHGMLFSVIFNKQFLVIPLSGSSENMNSRIFDFLKRYQLEERIYSGSLDKIKHSIDYNLVNQQILQDQTKALDWLKEIGIL